MMMLGKGIAAGAGISSAGPGAFMTGRDAESKVLSSRRRIEVLTTVRTDCFAALTLAGARDSNRREQCGDKSPTQAPERLPPRETAGQRFCQRVEAMIHHFSPLSLRLAWPRP